jgi:hypothetical protein
MKDLYSWLMIAISIVTALIPFAIQGEEDYQYAEENLPVLESRASNLSTSIDEISARIDALSVPLAK